MNRGKQEPKFVGHKIHSPARKPPITVRDVPGNIKLLCQAAMGVLSGPPPHQHDIFGPRVGTWDTTGTSLKPFDIHNCKGCGTTKAVKLADSGEQFEIDRSKFNWLPSQGVFGWK